MDDQPSLEPDLDRRPPAGARQWLMPDGRFTVGSVARAIAALWVGLILLATPPVLVIASREVAARADRVAAATAAVPPSGPAQAAAPESDDLRALSGVLLAGAMAVTALALVLIGQLAWRGVLSLREGGRGTTGSDAPPSGTG
jgi:hypothetical protein